MTLLSRASHLQLVMLPRHLSSENLGTEDGKELSPVERHKCFAESRDITSVRLTPQSAELLTGVHVVHARLFERLYAVDQGVAIMLINTAVC